jgi:shikimate dehydrogenase
MDKTVKSGKNILGIMGNPLSHSLSPVFQNYLCRKYAPEYVYVPFQISDNGAESFLKGMINTENFRGLNITIPFKERVFRLAEVLSPEAEKIEAVNTIIVENKKIYGYNTDIYGILSSFDKDLKMKSLKGKDTVLLGAGGAARAAVYALGILGAKSITVVTRAKSSGLAIKKWAEKTVDCDIILITWNDFDKMPVSRNLRLIINATPIGLKGELLPIDLDRLDKECKIFDMTYGTRRTPVVDNAISKGMSAVDGLNMLVYQGIKSFQLWTGRLVKPEGVIQYLNKKARYGKSISNR